MPGALTRWEPFAELGERTWVPPVDVARDNGNLVVRAAA
jgi:hypothetical protein